MPIKESKQESIRDWIFPSLLEDYVDEWGEDFKIPSDDMIITNKDDDGEYTIKIR